MKAASDKKNSKEAQENYTQEQMENAMKTSLRGIL